MEIEVTSARGRNVTIRVDQITHIEKHRPHDPSGRNITDISRAYHDKLIVRDSITSLLQKIYDSGKEAGKESALNPVKKAGRSKRV